MGFILIRVEVPNLADTQLNAYVRASSNAHEGVQGLINLLDAIQGGAKDAEVDVAVRATTLSIPADGSGLTAQYNLK